MNDSHELNEELIDSVRRRASQYAQLGASARMGLDSGGKASSICWWLHPHSQGLSATMQSGHHGSEWNTDDSGDLLVGETLNVVRQHYPSVPLGQRRQRLMRARQGLSRLLLRRTPRCCAGRCIYKPVAGEADVAIKLASQILAGEKPTAPTSLAARIWHLELAHVECRLRLTSWGTPFDYRPAATAGVKLAARKYGG